jgi:hypothetical protein
MLMDSPLSSLSRESREYKAVILGCFMPLSFPKSAFVRNVGVLRIPFNQPHDFVAHRLGARLAEMNDYGVGGRGGPTPGP